MQAIQKLSPKHPAEVGTREANKAKNRYANILCCKIFDNISATQLVMKLDPMLVKLTTPDSS